MPFVAGKNTFDTPNTDGNCIYPAKPLGGEPHKSSNVYFEGEVNSNIASLKDRMQRSMIVTFNKESEIVEKNLTF